MRHTISTHCSMYEKLRSEMVQSPLEGLARPSINRSRHRGLIERNRYSFVSRKPEHFKPDCLVFAHPKTEEETRLQDPYCYP